MTKANAFNRKVYDTTETDKIINAEGSKFTGKVFLYMFIALAITALTSLGCGALLNGNQAALDAMGTIILVSLLLFLPIFLWIEISVLRGGKGLAPAFIIYSAMMGVLLSFFVFIIPFWIIGTAFALTCAAFGVMALIAWTSKKNLNSLAITGYGFLLGILLISLLEFILYLAGVDQLALILSGASPIFIAPKIDADLEIANQPLVDDYINAMHKYPSAKAIFVINPTYFGAVNDLKRLVDEAHARGIAVLVDEAHGAHYYFDNLGPISAMDAGADMSSVSFHKTGGSLTQSSVLLLNSKFIDRAKVQKTLNILNTTSPSTILMASIDSARHFAATKGQEYMAKIHEISTYGREQIAKIKGFVPVGKEHFISHGCFDYDETKLVIKLEHLDINGFDLFRILREEYDIQIELAETYVIMGVLSAAFAKAKMNRFIAALKDISKKHYNKKYEYKRHAFGVDFPFQIVRPRSAYHAPGNKVELKEAVNCISKESIMIYPPGIPLIVPGEVFTKDLVDRIASYKKIGCTILSDYHGDYVNVIDTANWRAYRAHKNKLNDYLVKRISTPRGDGFSMPFEGNKHSGTIILLPFRKDTWRKNAEPALKNYKEVITSIAKYEPVYVGISPKLWNRVIKDYEGLKNKCSQLTRIFKENVIPISDKIEELINMANTKKSIFQLKLFKASNSKFLPQLIIAKTKLDSNIQQTNNTINLFGGFDMSKLFQNFTLSTRMVVILVVLGCLGLWTIAMVVAAIYMLNKFKVFGAVESKPVVIVGLAQSERRLPNDRRRTVVECQLHGSNYTPTGV